MTSVAILQARTTSARLPAKVLLPVAGVPMAVLAARRAANTGRTVIVATSSEPTDDALARAICEHGLACFRGSLDNVLERLVKAVADYDDTTIVCRLTADNVFPDGLFLDEMEQEFVARGLNYLTSTAPESGLPYGMSAEMTVLRHLRAAHFESRDRHDQEHVTPHVIRRFGREVFRRYSDLQKSHHRCTVDCLDDYLRIERVFAGCEDPIAEPALNLIERLAALEDAPLAAQPAWKMVLGGAQLGLDYGIANTVGKPKDRDSEALIKTAITSGVSYLDTARAYGSSEQVIGMVLSQGWADRVKVVTKLDLLQRCWSTANRDAVAAFVDASVFKSCVALRRDTLDVVLLHRAEHLDAWGGAAWERLQEHRRGGVIHALGVSVQIPAELARAVSDPTVSVVQLPFNILDRRWGDAIKLLQRARMERNLLVHTRSALLQGLLLSEVAALWRAAGVTDFRSIVDWLQGKVLEYGRESVADLCLAYARSQSWVDGVVVGVERRSQLAENIRYFSTPTLSQEDLSRIDLSRPWLSDIALDPSKWRGRSQ